MSLIRQILNIKEPLEYYASAMRVEPPENITEPFKVYLLLYNGNIAVLEALNIELRGVAVSGGVSKRNLCVKINGEGCLSRLDLTFPEGALVTYDNGALIVE
ncbi:MAG: hypothetical protein ACPLZ8_02745 [Fervidicoccaceae archaeon]